MNMIFIIRLNLNLTEDNLERATDCHKCDASIHIVKNTYPENTAHMYYLTIIKTQAKLKETINK